MHLTSLHDLDLAGKRVILRTAYDVPLGAVRGRHVVTDDSRIRATLPTIKYLQKKGCKIVILTWLGRPQGRDKTHSLAPVAQHLETLLKARVPLLPKSTGRTVEKHIAEMGAGEIVMLENIRFDVREEVGDMSLAHDLARLGDALVFDAFAQSHRSYPSTTGVMKLLPCVTGLNMEDEVHHLGALLRTPARPFVVVMGGAKISDKLETMRNILNIADVVLVGGAMAHNFLKAEGIKLGASLIEEASRGVKKGRGSAPYLEAGEMLHATQHVKTRLTRTLETPLLTLPFDLVAGESESARAKREVIDFTCGDHIPWDWKFLDIGPRTIAHYEKVIAHARTVFWNGPMGYAESPPFAHGTRAIAEAMAHNTHAKRVIGGGDTLAALTQMRLAHKMDFVSTGGGAALEMLAGTSLPVLPYLTA